MSGLCLAFCMFVCAIALSRIRVPFAIAGSDLYCIEFALHAVRGPFEESAGFSYVRHCRGCPFDLKHLYK